MGQMSQNIKKFGVSGEKPSIGHTPIEEAPIVNAAVEATNKKSKAVIPAPGVKTMHS